MKQKIDRSHYLFSNRDLVALIIPLLVEQFLSILVGMADSIMIASVGEAAVSGVSLVDNVVVLLLNGFAALATGGAVVAGQYLGQKKIKEACESATQLIVFITTASLVITVLVYMGKNIILHGVFGQIEPDVMAHANTYLLIVSASIPFMAMYNGGAAIFRAMGNSEVSMRVSIIMNIINISGNALLIYGFHRGTEGVAIPSLVSRMVAGIIIVGMLFNEKHLLHIKKEKYHFNWKMVKNILQIGVPNGLENSMFQLGKIIVLSLVSSFGTYAIAANAVGNMVALFEILPGIALGLAITTVISRCVGANDYEQVHYYMKKMIGMVYIGMFIMNALIIALLPVIIKAYHLSDITADTTRAIIYFHTVSCITIWPISFSLPSVFRAAGDAKNCMIIAIVSMWIFRIAFSYLLGKYMGWGIFGVWVAMVIDWVFRAICFTIRLFGKKWEKAAII